MSREISNEFREALYAQSTDEVFLTLIEIESNEIEEGIVRFVNNPVNIVSNGNTYNACAFRCILPDEKENSVPEATIEIDNVDRRIGLAIRQMKARPKFTIKVIRASNPDEIEIEFNEFVLDSATIDKNVLQGKIGVSSSLNQTFPKDNYSPTLFPGMF
jgi:hypothetical protein